MLRTCPGCGQTDEDPRHIVEFGVGFAAYHYDCVPVDVRESLPDSVGYAATQSGLRGADVAAAVRAAAEES